MGGNLAEKMLCSPLVTMLTRNPDDRAHCQLCPGTNHPSWEPLVSRTALVGLCKICMKREIEEGINKRKNIPCEGPHPQAADLVPCAAGAGEAGRLAPPSQAQGSLVMSPDHPLQRIITQIFPQ